LGNIEQQCDLVYTALATRPYGGATGEKEFKAWCKATNHKAGEYIMEFRGVEYWDMEHAQLGLVNCTLGERKNAFCKYGRGEMFSYTQLRPAARPRTRGCRCFARPASPPARRLAIALLPALSLSLASRRAAAVRDLVPVRQPLQPRDN
jgi:hypothetical protein